MVKFIVMAIFQLLNFLVILKNGGNTENYIEMVIFPL